MGVKGNDKISAPFVYLSESEVDAHDPNVKAVFEKLGLEYVLHNLWGFDKNEVYPETGLFYEIVECKHRTRIGNKIVDGNMIRGRERLDDEWIEKGNPSEDAKAIARQDMSYLNEVSKLGKRMKSL